MNTETALREALELMLDMWKRHCAPRDIEFDSQVKAARAALLASPPVQPGRVAVPLPYFPDFDLEEPMEYTQLRDEYMALCLFLRSNYRPTIPAETRQAEVLVPGVAENRRVFLAALRSGDYQKGPFVKGQDRPPEGAEGYCAIGLPAALFGIYKGITKGLKEKLGLTQADLSRIQNEWNDSDLTFPEIADKIEREIFGQIPTPPVPAAQGEYHHEFSDPGDVDPPESSGAILFQAATLTPVPSVPSWANSPIHKMVRDAGLGDSGPEEDPPEPRDSRAEFEKWYAADETPMPCHLQPHDEHIKRVAFAAWQARAGGAV